ncbi:uncharacterized protein LOC128552341 [Mercenaria mercenaria]|uniref:uncharacterized protein LOC128552341 n=1 Tax=Mercenaria mercenaria TaxID=6596 RepID=UPI00234F0E33|nr:uncharacterized protein LOC128552341 [Mercenaria mercenaria]
MNATTLIICILYIFNINVLVSPSQELLFEPRNGVKFSVRTEVPVLKVNYTVYKTALTSLVDDWLKGKIDTGQPTEQWERNYIARVNRIVNGEVNNCSKEVSDTSGDKSMGLFCSDENLDKKTRDVYYEMIKIKVPGHLNVVTSHRRWIRLTYKFLNLIGVKFSDKMTDLVRRHDLSKYTHREVRGYAIMFGDGALGYRN